VFCAALKASRAPLSDATNRNSVPSGMDGSSTDAKKHWSKQMAERLMSKKKSPNQKQPSGGGPGRQNAQENNSHQNYGRKHDDEYDRYDHRHAVVSPIKGMPSSSREASQRRPSDTGHHQVQSSGMTQEAGGLHHQQHPNAFPGHTLTDDQEHDQQKWLGTIFTAVDPELQQFVANTPHCSPPPSPRDRDLLPPSAVGSKLEITSSTQSAAEQNLAGPGMMRGSHGAHSLGNMLVNCLKAWLICTHYPKKKKKHPGHACIPWYMVF
jgi:hypothetical protein